MLTVRIHYDGAPQHQTELAPAFRRVGLVSMFGLAFLLSGCTSSMRSAGGVPRQPEVAPVSSGGAGGIMTADDRAQLTAIAAARGTSGDGYRIGPDDLLDIRIPNLMEATPPAEPLAPGVFPVVTSAPTYRQGTRVSASGDVSIPLLGLVKAQGLTPAQLERKIAEQLRKGGILRNPQVSIQITEYRSGVVAVIGSVERPGLYPLTRPGATVSDLIWAAGGPNKDAGRVVEFVPGNDPAASNADPSTRRSIRLDLDTLLHGGPQRGLEAVPEVRAGDVIALAPAGSVLVEGWVSKPGPYPVTRGLTVTGAVAAAGGPLYPADRQRIVIARAANQQSLTVDLDAIAEGRAADVVITDGDVVRVASSTGRLVPWGVWAITRDVVRIGGNVLLF